MSPLTIVWYDYADGSDGISTFLAEADGTFKTRTVAATIPAGNLWREHMKVVAGATPVAGEAVHTE
jgi:hypothetical protein